MVLFSKFLSGQYFEQYYLGLASVDSDVRSKAKFPAEFWNHYATILIDPDFPRTSNMVEGFHRGFRTRVLRARPSVQEYLKAEQVESDYHLDRLFNAGITPSKKRKTSSEGLFESFDTYTNCLQIVLTILLLAIHFC